MWSFRFFPILLSFIGRCVLTMKSIFLAPYTPSYYVRLAYTQKVTSNSVRTSLSFCSRVTVHRKGSLVNIRSFLQFHANFAFPFFISLFFRSVFDSLRYGMDFIDVAVKLYSRNRILTTVMCVWGGVMVACCRFWDSLWILLRFLGIYEIEFASFLEYPVALFSLSIF